MAKELRLNPTKGTHKTQRAFVQSQTFEVCLVGPRGEGKTEAGWRRVTQHAGLQPVHTRPIPWLIVRDTWTNLERTTLKSLLFPHPNSFMAQIRPLLKVKDGGRQITFPGMWEANLFGMDSIADLDNLQSMQLGGLWVEEPAPAAAEEIGGGMEERVVTVGISSLRHPCSWRTVQLTMNYPDEDHWSWRRYSLTKAKNRALYQIPRGENPHLPPDYRENMEEALADDQGLLQRLVLGQPGMVVQGKLVTPEFSLEMHKSPVELEVFPNLPGLRFWDGGLNPTCIFAQITPRGYVHIFKDTLVGSNMGLRQLIKEGVHPLLESRFKLIPEWRDIGDPSMHNREQSDSDQSASSVIQELLGSTLELGAVSWEVRREALKAALTRKIDGQMWIKLCDSEKILTRALRGGWHYRVDASGRILADKPVKDIHSHPGDAFSYGVTRLLHDLNRGLGNYIDLRAYKPKVLTSADWRPF